MNASRVGRGLRFVDEQDSRRLQEIYDVAKEADHVDVRYDVVSPEKGVVLVAPKRREPVDCGCGSRWSLLEWGVAFVLVLLILYKLVS